MRCFENVSGELRIAFLRCSDALFVEVVVVVVAAAADAVVVGNPLAAFAQELQDGTPVLSNPQWLPPWQDPTGGKKHLRYQEYERLRWRQESW